MTSPQRTVRASRPAYGSTTRQHFWALLHDLPDGTFYVESYILVRCNYFFAWWCPMWQDLCTRARFASLALAPPLLRAVLWCISVAPSYVNSPISFSNVSPHISHLPFCLMKSLILFVWLDFSRNNAFPGKYKILCY